MMPRVRQVLTALTHDVTRTPGVQFFDHYVTRKSGVHCFDHDVTCASYVRYLDPEPIGVLPVSNFQLYYLHVLSRQGISTNYLQFRAPFTVKRTTLFHYFLYFIEILL